MNDIEKLKEDAFHLVNDFYSLDLYKKYLIIKEEIEKDLELTKLKKEKDFLQKNLKNYHGKEKKEAFKLARELNDEYDYSPLITNFNSIKKQLEELLSPFIEFEF